MGNFKPTSGFEGNQRLNYLLYFETTGKNPLPDTDGRLAKEANSENSEFGPFHMARENFMDNYLLKKLRFFNKAMEPYGTYNKATLTDWNNIKCSWNSDLSIGTRNKLLEDSMYDWKYETWSGWAFESKLKIGADRDVAGLGGWSGESWGDSNAWYRNVIEFEPGSDIIRVSGTTHFQYRWELTDKKIIASNKVYHKELEYGITWKGTLDLEAVDDGGLQILATFDEPNINYICQDLAGLFGKADQLKNAVANAIKDTKNTKNDLVRDLANKQGLILPAAGIFFFKNPMLSWRGDLICSVA